ncbi:hypothetical protein [Microbacterium sp. T2.11-28]|uniref:hypothetical protein n=1 Tax=Microbacterium sp. T2.11-28 TaxID=3041169 RepID=UPI00247758A9|nr:hypothetical protein [Microbacterium sp. T2.11-28]CAI9393486.1 hypothetical protein MICABA_02463 [Microbacterium sp. T2.11-28]
MTTRTLAMTAPGTANSTIRRRLNVALASVVLVAGLLFTPTAAQQLAIQKCVTSLGYTWLTAVAGGPFGFTIGGVAIALWGCS